ncbi:MAG: hypothetical protein ABW219_12765 [Ilumatobacteraceae bacterium]
MTGRDDSSGLHLDVIKARRLELQALDDAVSYVRRVAQGRADLARAELARRGPGDKPQLYDDLAHVLGDHLLGSSDRPPRPAEDFSEHPLSAELDQLCADHGFGRLDELDEDELRSLAEALDRFEHRVSGERQEVFAELDDLTDELVIRYRAQAGDLEDEDDEDDERVVDGPGGHR